MAKKNKRGTIVQIMSNSLHQNKIKPKLITKKLNKDLVKIENIPFMERYHINPLFLTAEEKQIVNKKIFAFKKLWLPISIRNFNLRHQNINCSNELVPYSLDYIRNYPPLCGLKESIAIDAHIGSLNSDCILEIIQYLDIKSIMSLAYTCKSMYFLLTTDHALIKTKKKIFQPIKNVHFYSDKLNILSEHLLKYREDVGLLISWIHDEFTLCFINKEISQDEIDDFVADYDYVSNCDFTKKYEKNEPDITMSNIDKLNRMVRIIKYQINYRSSKIRFLEKKFPHFFEYKTIYEKDINNLIFTLYHNKNTGPHSFHDTLIDLCCNFQFVKEFINNSNRKSNTGHYHTRSVITSENNQKNSETQNINQINIYHCPESIWYDEN